ncbi:MAG TPA: hypothetical protein VLU41_09295 [Ideonella sp.]|nr:hypothetical protein [Ideonella sp.]
MLDTLKRLLRRDGQVPPAWPGVEHWASASGRGFRPARDGAGFVVEGRYEERPWRLEWGPSQRDYLVGKELRLRMDLTLPHQLQLLVASRELMKWLEGETFERYTDQLQTHIDSSTPEEMRWLVMFPKLSLRAMPALHARLGAVGASLPALSRWIEGLLAVRLEQALGRLLAEERPFVLMTNRNRVMLRVELPEPAPEALDQAVALFESAVARVPNAIDGLAETSSAWPSTAASAWHHQGPGEGVGSAG